MNSIHIISQDVFDKVRSRFQNLEMGDDQGAVTSDPKKARFFDFDFVIEGDNLGRVSISINELGSLKIFYSQGILEDQDSFVKQLWYDFLREMRMFAKRRLLRFDTRDITKSHLNKDDFQYLASTGQKETEMPSMQESKMFGSTKSSYLPLEKTKLIVRHNKPVDETQLGARSRRNNIKALYIENQDGERFKYPFEHLAGAKAMQRHVANGGRPYDDAGKAIIEMSQHIAELAAFKRHVGLHDSMNREVNEITHKADQKLVNLKKTMENLCRQSFYEQWKETIQPFTDEQMVLDQATMEDYKSKFTVKSFKEDLTQFFPLIHRIMQETGTLDLETYVQDEEQLEETETVRQDEFESFVDWANRIEEGRMEPDTLMQLKELVESGLSLGVDGVSAIEALQGIGIHDDILESALSELAKVNPEADPVPTIKSWLMKEDPEAAQDMGMSEDQEEEGVEPQQVNLRQIAEMVKQFYDRETGKFPKGETGVVLHVKKELGEEAAALAEKLVNQLSQEADQRMLQQGYGSSDDPMSLSGRVPQDTAFRNRERNAGLENERNNYQVTINGKPWKVFADQRQAMNIARSLKMKGKDVSVSPTGAPTTESMQGVAEGEGKTQKYEMMMRNGQVKRFTAKDDADAKRIAAGHGAKSVIRMKGNVPGDKIAEQGVAEGSSYQTDSMVSHISQIITDIYPQGGDKNTYMKLVAQKMPSIVKADPKLFRRAFGMAYDRFFHIDQDSDDDYTDYSMRQGERGMEENINGIELNGKMVDSSSLEVDGVDRRDYPDYVDAYFSSGEYTDGTPLSDEDLAQLTDLHGDLVNQIAHGSYQEDMDADDQALEAMSRHAKGWKKYGPGMKELAKAGKAGASEEEMDRIRKKHDRYDEEVDMIRKLAGMAK